MDTASYTRVRGLLNSGELPPADAVRIEELINYFGYDYPEPAPGELVDVVMEIAEAPWAPSHQLVHIGLRSKTVATTGPSRRNRFVLTLDGVAVGPMGAAHNVVAKDVKLQIEFNPAQIKGYRLLGYEDRRLSNEDFNDDTRDTADLRAGDSATALYEIIPVGSNEPVRGVDPLKYQQITPRPGSANDEVLTVRVRYKAPEASVSRLLERALTTSDTAAGVSDAFRFASAVAEFGLLLRDSPYQGDASYERAFGRVQEALGDDESGRGTELLSLIRAADNLTEQLHSLMSTSQDLRPGRAELVQVTPGEGAFFKLSAIEDGVYTIDAVANSRGLDPMLYLFQQIGNQFHRIAFNDDGGDGRLDSRIVRVMDGAANYFVFVRDGAGNPGPITLSIMQ